MRLDRLFVVVALCGLMTAAVCASSAYALTTIPSLPTDNPAVDCAEVQPPLDHFYPPRAQAEAMDGEATVACKVGASDDLQACTWTSETPPNYGFGRAAATIACTFHPHRPDTVAGASEWYFSTPVKFKAP
jgi:hypothetical protein